MTSRKANIVAIIRPREVRFAIVVMAFAAIHWGFPRVQLPYSRDLYSIGDLPYWIALFVPLWMPAVFARGMTLVEVLRMLLVLPAMAWYSAMTLAFVVRPFSWYVIVLATVISIVSMAFAFRSRWWLTAVPLFISMICGTISILSR